MKTPGLLDGLIARAIALLLLSVALGATLNALSPGGLPWTYPWSRYVEIKAHESGVPLADLAQARQAVETGKRIVLDARKTADYERGRLPGAMSLPYSDADRALTELQAVLSKRQPLLVYCASRSCDEGLLLCVFLKERGYTDVQLLLGGFAEWRNAGLEVEQ